MHLRSSRVPRADAIWHSPVAFPDLPQSVAEASRFNCGSFDKAHDRVQRFWLQFQDPTSLILLDDRLKQLKELQKLVRPAMKDLFKGLWYSEPVLTSYFELVCRIQAAGSAQEVEDIDMTRRSLPGMDNGEGSLPQS